MHSRYRWAVYHRGVRNFEAQKVPTGTGIAGSLDRTLELGVDVVTDYRRNGHAVVRELASAQEIAQYAPAIKEATRELSGDLRPLSERDTYGKAFIQSMNLWTVNPVVREFVFAKRFAKVAADLMGVDGVRLYHDQSLFKEPGGGITPWHQDQVYWPLDTAHTITMWMPLVDVPTDVGSVVFASGSHTRGDLGGSIIGDGSQQHFDRLIERDGYELTSYAPMRAGDATFHSGWTLHGAPANETSTMRSVMTIIYFADGTRVGEVEGQMQRDDHQQWLGSLPTGSLANSELNPLLWSRVPASA
jgi:ectoine hydroxylase-related dioxygenase (phytanoyl-CoA dioxygenase family)